MSKEELIELFKKQHDTLQDDLLHIDAFKGEMRFGENSLNALQKFKADLLGHLSIEDTEFYPNYLKLLQTKGGDTAKTKIFIDEMNQIKLTIVAFLDKYGVKENIENDPSVFLAELGRITSTLNLRIETEEDGVYGVYLSM